MELLILAIPALILLCVWMLKPSKPFEAPKVSAIDDSALAAFERVPSLWVNASEQACFLSLRNALITYLPPGWHVHGKTRLEDVIRVKRGVEPKARWSLRGRVKSRHLDYLITDPSGAPILAIELDGKSHNAAKPSKADQVKTALCGAVGMPLKRVRVGENFEHIAATIATELRSR